MFRFTRSVTRLSTLYGLYLALRNHLHKNNFTLQEFYLRFLNGLVPVSDLEHLGLEATKFVSLRGFQFLGELLSDEELRETHDVAVENLVSHRKPQISEEE